MTPLFESLDLAKLTEKFGSDEKCRECLEQLRWPEGPRCPRCDCQATKVANRFQYDCNFCHYQFSVTVGTIFQDSHLSLWKWFLATYMITESRKGMSANQIKRMLGISYKTAWYLCHRIRAAMVETGREPLKGVVEMDETFVGGHHHHGHVGYKADKKEPVVGIRQRGGELRFFHAKDIKSGTLAKYIRENMSGEVEMLITDDANAYRGAASKLRVRGKHSTINHSQRVYVVGDIHTNTVESAFSLLKRGVMGTWHKISAKHLHAYCNEMEFRFNNWQNPFLFRDTLLKLIAAPTLEYKNLTAENAA